MLPVVKKLNSFLPYPCPAIVKPPLRPIPSPTSMLQVFSPRGVANRRAERPLRLSLLLNAAARKREVIVRKVSYEDGPAFSSTRETKRWLNAANFSRWILSHQERSREIFDEHGVHAEERSALVNYL